MTLTREEANLVRKLVLDALITATDKTIREKVGDQEAVRVAVNLYYKLADT